MSKKKNDEEKEVKTEAQNQEESKTDAEDNKAEAKEKENPLEKELKDTKDQLLRVTAEYSNFRKRSEKEKMKLRFCNNQSSFGNPCHG